MLALINKFVSYVTDFFSSIFSFPGKIIDFLRSGLSLFGFLGEDVVTVIAASVATLLALLLIYLIVKLVVNLL